VVEHFLGKEEVKGSIPFNGSISSRMGNEKEDEQIFAIPKAFGTNSSNVIVS
jgi:hypothetical protein